MAYSPDGAYFVTVSVPGSKQYLSDLTAHARIWDTSDWSLLFTLDEVNPDFEIVYEDRGNKKTASRACAFSPDSEFVLIGSASQTVWAFDVSTGHGVAALEGHFHWNQPGGALVE